MEHDVIAAFLKGLVETGEKSDRIKSAAITNTKLAALLKKANVIDDNSFLDRLQANKELHSIVSKLSWGMEDE